MAGEHDREQGEHEAVDQHAADHGAVLRLGRPLDLAADLRGALRVPDHEEHPRQHQQGVDEAERRAVARVAGLLRRRDDLVEAQPVVPARELVPAGGDVPAVEEQQREGHQEADARDGEQELLPPPVPLTAQHDEHAESDGDDRAEPEHPPLGGDAEQVVLGQERVAHVEPDRLAGDRRQRGQRGGHREGEREVGVEPDPEEDHPEALAPGEQESEDGMQGAADEHVVAAGARHRGGELGVHPEQRERHQQGADDHREQHVAPGERRLRLEEEEDAADRDVHPEGVHHEGVEEGHLADQSGGVPDEDAGLPVGGGRRYLTRCGHGNGPSLSSGGAMELGSRGAGRGTAGPRGYAVGDVVGGVRSGWKPTPCWGWLSISNLNRSAW